jgi:hypothetical protein
MTVILASASANSFNIASESSDDPSSTQTNSISNSTGESKTRLTIERKVRDSL